MADTRSAAEIEREIEEERSALTRTLDEIQDRLSFETFSNNMMGSLRDHGGDIGRSVGRAVKDNPIPLALTAVGLAWLALSSSRSSRGHDYDYDYGGADYSAARRVRPVGTDYSYRDPLDERTAPATAGTATARPVYDASGRPLSTHQWDDEDDPESRWDRARHAASQARHGAGARLHEGKDAASARAAGAAGSASDAMHRGGAAASDAMHRGGAAASGAAHRAGAGMSDAAHRAGEGMSSAAARARAGVSHAGHSARHRAQGAYASAAELRERITHGTRDLSEQARARVLAARTRAYEAQLRAEYMAARGRDKAMDVYEEQPMLAGALAVAFGAAVGAMLPRTQREDRAFGQYRDDLFEEAEHIYREERAKLEDVARSTADEAKRVARDTAHDLREDAESKTKEAAQKVADTAKSEAEKKNLGNPS